MPDKTRSVAITSILFLILTIFSAVLAIPGAAQTGQSPLRIVQYNVYYGKGTDEIYDRERQVRLMATANPDIISLNEILPGEAGAYKTMIAGETGVAWHSFHAVAQSDGTGNLILSRYPFISTSSYNMQTNGQYSRGVTQATIDVNGNIINFFSTHLDHNDDTVRLAQVEEVKTFMANFPEPRIIAGDFNAKPDKVEMINFVEDYHDSWEQARALNTAFAYPDNPVGPNTRTLRDRIDYVFYSKNAANIATEESRIPDQRDLNNTNVRRILLNSDDLGVRPSDHNMVSAVLTLGPASVDSTPPAISAVSSTVTPYEAAISWETDEPSDTQVSYGQTSALESTAPLNAALVTSHSMTLNNLTANTLYYYQVRSVDAAGNSAVSPVLTFTTAAPPDAVPPSISNVAVVDITSTGATITWTTDEPSYSQAEYGRTLAYGSVTAWSSILAVSHQVILSGLAQEKVYNVRVMSRDAAGNLATSGNFTFRTLRAGGKR